MLSMVMQIAIRTIPPSKTIAIKVITIILLSLGRMQIIKTSLLGLTSLKVTTPQSAMLVPLPVFSSNSWTQWQPATKGIVNNTIVAISSVVPMELLRFEMIAMEIMLRTAVTKIATCLQSSLLAITTVLYILPVLRIE